MEAQRRQVVVLFADLVGFTTFSERFGEEAAFGLVRATTAVIDRAARAEGAKIHNVVGDGVIVVFGAPVADEDAPMRACRAALACLSGLEEVWNGVESQYGVRPAVRIGVNAGPAVFGAIGDEGEWGATVLGDTVNLASRIQALAAPGAILLTEAARRLVDGRVELVFDGEHVVKGRQAPERVYRLNGLSDHATRFQAALDRGLTAFVGRAGELDALLAELDGSAGAARLIDVVGEPGIGKSRLVYEFHLRLQASRALVLSGICTPEAREKPFHAFIDIIRGAFHVARDSDRAALEARLEEGLQALGLAGDEAVDLLVNLLGLAPSRGRVAALDGVLIGLRTRELIVQIFRARASLAPLVLLIDDVHWIDSASQALIGQLADIQAPAPLLIMHTRRPGGAPPWIGPLHARQLRLDPLDARETSRLIRARFAGHEASEALVSRIAAKADGNALFAEEIVSYLIEHAVAPSAARDATADAEALAAATPQTAQAIFASRIDRLPAEAGDLLQVAAIVGRRFDPRFVAGVAKAEDRAEEIFATLARHDLIRADEGAGEYEFKHPLLRDTIRDRLLSGPRKAIHAAIAEELERRSGNALTERVEQLAYHFAAADNPVQAFRYLAMAARKSLNMYAIPEAEAHLRKALAILDRHPDAAPPREIAGAVVALLETLMLKSEYGEAGRIAEAYMPQVRSAGDTRELVVASYYLVLALVQQYRLRDAHMLASEALAAAERLGDERARAFARVSLMQCRTRLALDTGEEAARRRDELIADSLRLNDNFLRNSVYFVVCWDCVYRGLLREARAHALQLNAAGVANGDPRAISFANWMLGWIHIVGGGPENAMDYANEALRAAIAPFDRLQAEIILAVAAVLTGRAQEGLAQIRGLNAQFTRLGALYNVLEAPLGVALIGTGRVSEGIATIERAIATREAAGDRTAAGWARILLAEVYIEIAAGGRRASWRVVLANLRTLVAAKMRGARVAAALLDEVAAHTQWSPEGVVFARLQFNRGRLHELGGRRGEAARCFALARDLSRAQGLASLCQRSEAALARVA